MPKTYFADIAALYPDEPLFARVYQQQDGQVVQLRDQQDELLEQLEKLLFRYIDKNQYYHCA